MRRRTLPPEPRQRCNILPLQRSLSP